MFTNKMTSKNLLRIISSSLFVILIGIILNLFYQTKEIGYVLLNIGAVVGQLSGIYLLFRNSMLQTTVFWKIIKFFIGLTILGALFKIQHWVGAGILLLISQLGICATYTIRFLLKKYKKRLDILKFLYIFSATTTYILTVQHWIRGEYRLFPLLIFWILLLDFIMSSFDLRIIFKNNKE